VSKKYNRKVILSLTGSAIRDGALRNLVPELYAMKGGKENNPWHNDQDFFEHTLGVFEEARKLVGKTKLSDERKEIVLWVALLHDIAKPETLKDVGDYSACPGHAVAGAVKARKILERLGLAGEQINKIVEIVRDHDQGLEVFNGKDVAEIEARRKKLETEHGEVYGEMVVQVAADVAGSDLKLNNPEDYKKRVGYYRGLVKKKFGL